jgi:CTP:molybdopterin cytidylyltransferase MocA
MGATLAQGVAACGDWDGLLVVLGDMAWVRAETLATLYAALTPDVIVQPLYRGDAGSPVAGNPVAGSPVAGSPVAGSPVAGNPVAGNPVAGSPVAGSPVAGNPVAGNPVGFGAKFFPALRALDGDRGGRVVVEQYRECLRQVETNDPGVLRDLDEPPAKN